VLKKTVEFAHEIRQRTEPSARGVLRSWDEFLEKHVGSRLFVLWQRQSDVLVTKYATLGLSMDIQLVTSGSLVSHAFSKVEPLSLDLSTNASAETLEHPALIEKYEITHVVFSPVYSMGNPIGVFGVYFSSPENAAKLEPEVLTTISDSVANVLTSGVKAPEGETELLYKSATILDAMTAAMSHYHSLSHSNIDALNACANTYRYANTICSQYSDCDGIGLLNSIEALHSILSTDRDILKQFKDSYIGLSDYKAEFTDIALDDLRDGVLKRFNSQLRKGNTQLNVSFEAGLKLVSDRRKLEAILDNLIKNALDFTRDVKNGAKISVSHKFVGSNSVFEVLDNGVGMTEDVLKKAVDAFFTTRESDGIGLFIVDNFSKQLGGTLAIQSSFGEFTRITVTIPSNGR